MEKPIIGIPELGNTVVRKYMKQKYIDSIRDAGGIPRVLPWATSESTTEQYVKECDGLLLAGGPDISPSYYGQEINGSQPPMKERDAAEFMLLEKYIKTRKPIWGICRGMQLLNIFQGGTMHQDITPIQTLNHSDFPHRASVSHTVKVEKESWLGEIFGMSEIKVNSLHHQAADQVGKNLVVTASSEDGFVEGVELSGHPFCVGVQWHPEHMYCWNALQRRLFKAFILACSEN